MGIQLLVKQEYSKVEKNQYCYHNTQKAISQVISPDEGILILKAWKAQPEEKWSVAYFAQVKVQYGDTLVHCTTKLEAAIRFVQGQWMIEIQMIVNKLSVLRVNVRKSIAMPTD